MLEPFGVASAIIAFMVVVAVPIAFALYVLRIRHIAFELHEVLFGVIACYFVQTILFSVIVNLAASAGLISDAVLQQAVYWLAGAACFLLSFYALKLIAFRGCLSEGRISRVAIGSIAIKAVSDLLAAAWSNVNVAWHIMDGSLTRFLQNQVSNPSVDVAALEALWRSYGPVQYLHTAVLTIMMALASYLLLLQIAEKKPVIIQLAYVLMFSFLYNYTLAFPVPWPVTITAAVFCAVQILSIVEIMREYLSREERI